MRDKMKNKKQNFSEGVDFIDLTDLTGEKK